MVAGIAVAGHLQQWHHPFVVVAAESIADVVVAGHNQLDQLDYSHYHHSKHLVVVVVAFPFHQLDAFEVHCMQLVVVVASIEVG